MANAPDSVNELGAGTERGAPSAPLPWWLTVIGIASAAAMFASLYGGKRGFGTFVAFLVFWAVALFIRKQRRARLAATNVGPPQTGGKRRGASMMVVVVVVMIAVMFIAANLLSHAVPPGTPQSYGVQFLSAAAVLSVGKATMTYLGARRRSEQPHDTIAP